MSSTIRIRPIEGLPELKEGDDLAEHIHTCTPEINNKDIFVISQKAVSKVEGRVVAITNIHPSEQARKLAKQQEKDPALVEIILRESTEIIRAQHGVLICRTNHGFVCANAGIDSSNIAQGHAVLLPKNPDLSAQKIRNALMKMSAKNVGVIIADSFGRAWRTGQCDVAIGAAGVLVSNDLRGTTDSFGQKLKATEIAVGDQLAAAADLARHKTSGEPVVQISGCPQYVIDHDGSGAQALLRSRSADLFK